MHLLRKVLKMEKEASLVFLLLYSCLSLVSSWSQSFCSCDAKNPMSHEIQYEPKPTQGVPFLTH